MCTSERVGVIVYEWVDEWERMCDESYLVSRVLHGSAHVFGRHCMLSESLQPDILQL